MSTTFTAVLVLLAATLAMPSARAQSDGSASPNQSPAGATGAVSPPGTSQAVPPATPQEKKHAKHVYTDDDFGASFGDDLPPGSIRANNMAAYYLPNDPMTAQQLASLQQYVSSQVAFNRAQSIASIAKLYLRDDDVPFHGRDDWDRRAFDTWTEIWKVMADFGQRLQAVRVADAALLAEPQHTPRELAHLREQRTQLIAEWGLGEKAVNHFIALEHEANQKAAEWRKYNSR